MSGYAGPAVSIGQNPSIIGEARNNTQEDKKMIKLSVYDCEKLERNNLVRAALVLLMWTKFLARLKLLLVYLALSDHSFAGCSGTASMEEECSHGRCLNDTSRAISDKLEAASQLPSKGGLLFTQLVLCSTPEESYLAEKVMQRKSSLWVGVFRHFERCTIAC